MKTNYIKGSIVLAAILAVTIGVKAQTSDSTRHKKGYYDGGYNNTDEISTTAEGKAEHIRTNWKDTYYEFKIVNNKMTELYVEGDKIPAANWGKYSAVIADIREQVRKDRVQAKKDQQQANLDQIQAKKDQEQARRDQAQAKLEQEQAKRDQIQAGKDQEQAKRDQEQAERDQIQAKKDQEEANRDQEEAKRDQEQARLDQIQARKDQEEARKEQEMVKQMIADLVSDKIVPDAESLRDLTLNSDEMTVNGTKQPDAVFKKYKEKYKHFATGNFSYGSGPGDGQHNVIHFSHFSQ
jgi:flagellar biosynthesis GTPase FlhF